MFFTTKEGMYIVDAQQKTISYGDNMYEYAQLGPVMVGDCVNVQLSTGKNISTGEVVSVHA